MHVFLAGSTGVLGRRIIPLLVEQGHRVTGLTRRPDQAAAIAGPGVDIVVGDALNAADVVAAVRRARPDVLMNQLTDLRAGIGPGNSRIRTIGGENLAEAAEAAGVRRMIAQSVAWAYGPGERPAPESEPLDPTPEDSRAAMVRAVRTLEQATASAPEWLILRYGMLYGPGTWFDTDGERAHEARRGELRATTDLTSFVHVDDAARAAVAALSWPSGPVNVCDDEPAPGTDWVPAFCAAVGAPPPPIAAPVGRAGWARGADNTWLRTGLHFALDSDSWRAGFARLGHGSAGATP